ncbi:hypothetical protein DOK67_0002317 [Enterococcus sp. DIV0212c]|uniref:pectate lyase-like adhesive domain-containing protein n=1 Tax=Enterococcus sp. DIV0212c TaxID=2230867 RepID=UPI001A9B82C4|nr:pectate lyase-like adhesive domain-containing protein [Enterococcus sp. DIV0212c]MBO1355277.1 hypothetical protein [Enterococcus sp. DIV0212c]
MKRKKRLSLLFLLGILIIFVIGRQGTLILGAEEASTNEVAEPEPISTQYGEYSDGKNINYGIDDAQPWFRDLDIPETSANRAEVSTAVELKAAIASTRINYIYFINDITFTGGQKIPYEKKYMRISGKNPRTGKIHTLKETRSGSSTDNIHVSNNATQRNYTSYGLEDIKIDGYNYYGPINVNDSSYHVTLTYTNVEYNGPQLTHNLNGTTDYHNMKVQIPGSKAGSTETQELVEGHYVNIYGEFDLSHNGRHSIVWIGFGFNVRTVNGRFVIKKDANVKIDSIGRSFFYLETKDGEFEIEEGANVNIITGGGLIRNDISSVNRSFAKMDVGKNATLKITRTVSSNAADNLLPSFKMNGDFNVADGARVYLYNESASSGQADEFFRFYNSNGRINIDNAKSVLFYNPKGNIIRATTNGYTNRLTANIQSMNLWSTNVPTSKFNVTPDHHFSLPDLSNISFAADITRIANNNYSTTVSNAKPATINSTALNFNQLKVISMGIEPEVTVNEITDAMEKITGTGTIDGIVVATYNDGEGNKSLQGTVDRDGQYSITIPKRVDGTGAYIKPYTTVKIEIFYDFRTTDPIFTEVIDVSPPIGDPVITIIDQGTPQNQFPLAKDLVANLWDKSLNTTHPKLSAEYGKIKIPDLSVAGPVLPKFEVNVVDEAKNSSTISVPIFIKDKNTVVSEDKRFALRGVDFEVESNLYPKTEADLIKLIKDNAEISLWNVATGEKLDPNNVVIDKNLLPNPLGGVPALGSYKVKLSYGSGNPGVTREITVKIIPSIADLMVHFVNELGAKLHEPVKITDKIGTHVNLTKNTAVRAALADVKSRNFELSEPLASENDIEIVKGGSTVTYKFKGILFLSSAPKQLDFGLEEASAKDIRVNTATIDKNLIVSDTRAVKQNWTLKAKITKEFTTIDGSNKTISGILRYNDGGNSEKKFALGQDQDLLSNKNANNVIDYDVSGLWSPRGKGFKLDVPGDYVKQLGNYQATIVFTLGNTP